MTSFCVLLFTLLLYISFATLVNVFIATDTSTQLLRIKTKIFFHTFVAPIMFAVTIFIVLITDNKIINIIFSCGLILGSLIRIFSTHRKYLAEFQIVNSSLSINYMTPFLKLKSRHINLADISNIEIEKSNWFIDYPAALNVKDQESWLKFEIIDKKLKTEVQKDINAANKNLAASRADNTQQQL